MVSRSSSSTPTATTPTPSSSSPGHASSSFSPSPLPLPLPLPLALPNHRQVQLQLQLQLQLAPSNTASASTTLARPVRRPSRRMSSPSIQLNPPNTSTNNTSTHTTATPASATLALDDIVIGGECGVVNGGTALGPHPPLPSENWIAYHLTTVLQHSFTVSSPHPITSAPNSAHHYVHHPDQPPKSRFLTFRDSLSPEHLRNKFSITSLSSFTTSTTTDEDEDDDTDEVEEAESQDSTASSCYFLNITQRPPSPSWPCCAPSASACRPRPSASSEASSSCSPSPPTTLLPLPPSSAPVKSSSSRLQLIQVLNTWSFDANSLSSLQIRCSLHILLSIYLEYTPGFIQQLEALGVVDPVTCLRGLVDNLEVAYDSRNAYHNFRHAVDVVQAVYTILSHEGIVPPLGWVFDKESGNECHPSWQRQPAGRIGRLLDEMTVWALLLAAAGHDVGHPGLSNAFMVNARTPIAYVFSDGAVLENFHRITFTRMLREHGFEKMVDGHAGFRQVLVGAVLSTDMGRHFPIVEQLKRLASEWTQSPEDDSGTVMDEQAQKVLITAGLIKCGDISNSSRPHHISLTWSSCLLTEWSRQAALEADLHLPVSVVTLDPAEKRAQAKSQIGFTTLFVLPLFTVMEQLSPTAFRPFADNCRLGLTTWQKVVEQIDSQSLGPTSGLVIDPASDPVQPTSPLSTSHIPDQEPIDDTLQALMIRSPCVVDFAFSPLSGGPCDVLSSVNFSQPQTVPPANAEIHLTPKSKHPGWWPGPSSCPTSDDYNAEDSNLSSISSSSVSTLRDSSHATHLNTCLLESDLPSDLTPPKNPPPASGLDALKTLSSANADLSSPHGSFNFNVVLSHPDRHSNASFSSDEGKANSSNDDSSFSSLGSPSSPPRSPYFNSEVYSASSTGSSNDGARARVVLKQVQFDPSGHPHLPVHHHLRSPQRPRDKGMSVDAGLVHRNLTRTSLPIRKKFYSPHLVNQQVACAKGCGKVTVKCVKCATKSKIKMYRSLSLAKPSLFGNQVEPGLRSPSGSHLPEHPHLPNQSYSSRAPHPDAINLFTLPRLSEEKSSVSPNSAGFPNQELSWPPHPFRPLC